MSRRLFDSRGLDRDKSSRQQRTYGEHTVHTRHPTSVFTLAQSRIRNGSSQRVGSLFHVKFSYFLPPHPFHNPFFCPLAIPFFTFSLRSSTRPVSVKVLFNVKHVYRTPGGFFVPHHPLPTSLRPKDSFPRHSSWVPTLVWISSPLESFRGQPPTLVGYTNTYRTRYCHSTYLSFLFLYPSGRYSKNGHSPLLPDSVRRHWGLIIRVMVKTFSHCTDTPILISHLYRTLLR